MSKDDNVFKLPVVHTEDQVQSLPDSEIPDFIDRIDIGRMNDEQLEQLLTGIKKRRMSSFVIYERTQKDKDKITREKAKGKIDVKCTQIIKKLNMIDRHYEQLETMIQTLRGLRVEAGLEII